ncbi:MAG: hypothetical protein HOM74_04515, partial [Proteobacteria bacterium]|nr:hypothetical protein [Pseudomonadota bacterium]
MVKGITLGVVTSMLTIGCGGGGGGGGGDNVDVDLCLSVSCINYVSDQAEYLAQDGLNNIDAANANLASANFWGDLSGLLIQPSFIPNQLHDQIEM